MFVLLLFFFLISPSLSLTLFRFRGHHQRVACWDLGQVTWQNVLIRSGRTGSGVFLKENPPDRMGRPVYFPNLPRGRNTWEVSPFKYTRPILYPFWRDAQRTQSTCGNPGQDGQPHGHSFISIERIQYTRALNFSPHIGGVEHH